MQVMTSSTTAGGVTASSSSSHAHQQAHVMHVTGGFDLHNSANTPLSRGQRANRGMHGEMAQPVVLGSKQQSLSKSIKQAQHLVFVDSDQVGESTKAYQYTAGSAQDQRFAENGGHRVMTLTDPSTRNQTESKKQSSNYRAMVEGANLDQRRY